MGTRSRIGIEDGETGKVSSIYCHWDGYPGGVGATLVEHYKDRAKVEKLIALGGISALGATIGEKHNFDSGATDHPNWTLFYHRDRGDPLNIETDDSANDMYRRAAGGWEEYAYIYRQGVWFVTPVGGGAGPFLVKASDPEGTLPPNWERVEAVLAMES